MAENYRKEWWHAEALRRFASGSGESVRDIESALRSMAETGQKAPSKSVIHRFVSSKPTPAPDSTPEPPSVHQPKPRELPPSVLTPDRTRVSKESLADDLSVQFNQLKALIQTLTENGDTAGAMRAQRILTSLAALLQKEQAREANDGEFVRVRETDITAAAERARSKLHDLVSRLAAERGR